jgi:hypothetical protein
MRRFGLPIIAMLALFVSPAEAQRAAGFHGWGPRGGVTIDPDQAHVGAHFDLGDLAPRLMLFPNVEIGFGDDVTVLAPMFEVDYRFTDSWGTWSPYLGGGLGPVFAWSDGSSSTDVGLTIQAGIARQLSSQPGFMFFEFKVGLIDYPEVKFTIGWNFGQNKSKTAQPAADSSS